MTHNQANGLPRVFELELVDSFSFSSSKDTHECKLQL